MYIKKNNSNTLKVMTSELITDGLPLRNIIKNWNYIQKRSAQFECLTAFKKYKYSGKKIQNQIIYFIV